MVIEHMPFNVIYVYIFCIKVTFESSLGVIGGTMGLLTGFSILSGVEIIFFLIKILVKFLKDGQKMLANKKK